MKRTLALIFFLIGVCEVGFTQTWTTLNGPFGGNVVDIERAPNNALYAATASGGYKSVDGGVTWTRITGITNYDVRDFEINPTSGRIYAVCNGTANQLWISDNNGADWASSTVTGLENATRIEINPSNLQILFISGYNELFRGENGGTTWTQMLLDDTDPFPAPINDIAITSAGTVFVACENQSVYRSFSGGLNWSASSQRTIAGSTTVNIKALATYGGKIYALTFGNEIYRSDQGNDNTWTSIITASLTESSNVYTGQISFTSSGTLLLAMENSFWTTSNPADVSPTWEQHGSPSSWWLARVIAGAGSDIYVTSHSSGITRSTDNGATWQSANNGILAHDPTDIIQTSDGRIIASVETHGILTSDDQGANWKFDANANNNTLEYFRKLVELNDGSVLALGGYSAKKFVGVDAFEHVSVMPSYMPFFAYSRKAVGSIVVAAGGMDTYTSTDEGATWAPFSLVGLPGSFFYNKIDMEKLTNYTSPSYGYLYLETSGEELYRLLMDGGNVVSQIFNLPGYNEIVDFQVLHVKNGDILYVLTRQGSNYDISRSADHGDTWTTVRPTLLANSNARRISVLTDETVNYKHEDVIMVFADAGKIYKSTDTGENWSVETPSPVPNAVFGKALELSSGKVLLVGEGLPAHISSGPLLVPARPTGLRSAAVTDVRATLKWSDNSSIEETFVIEQSVGNDQNFELHTEVVVDQEVVIFTNLLPETHYYFRIRAKNKAGMSTPSNVIDFTTLQSGCVATIPDNKSWSTVVQFTRGPEFARLEPEEHFDPDQPYKLIFDATATELQGATKVYASTGVILVNIASPLPSDASAPWEHTVGNWSMDDGVGEMTAVPGQANKWELVLGPSLRSYFGVAPGESIYWLAAVFRNANGSVKATNAGSEQDVFISIEKSDVLPTTNIRLIDPTSGRYEILGAAPGGFFESCGTIATYYEEDEGVWDQQTKTLSFNGRFENQMYPAAYATTMVLNVADPIPAVPTTPVAYPVSATSNLITWTDAAYATKYEIQRAVACPSDLGGLVNYSTTNLDDGVGSFFAGPVTGTITITDQGNGNYSLSDYSFGVYGHWGYWSSPPASAFNWSHNCGTIVPTGGYFSETWPTYTLSNITATQLTINWVTGFADAATTVLTRTDGKSWLLQLSETEDFQTVGTVNYPARRFVDSDPTLEVGTQYVYRIVAINDAGAATPSGSAKVTVANTMFSPRESETLNQITFTGQGVMCVDLDDDGDDDLVMATFQNGFSEFVNPYFFRNDGAGNFDEVDVPALIGENVTFYRGLFAADLNSDNLPDIYCSRGDFVDGSILQDILLINQGNFTFTKTKVPARPGTASQFNGATALDYDKDGDLDLFVVGGIETNPHNFLLTNSGNGTFTQNTTAGAILTDNYISVEASTIDYDNDGDLDLLSGEFIQSAPFSLVRLYRNNSDGTFTRITGQALDVNVGSRFRSISIGDIDNNGSLDIYAQSNNNKYLYANNSGTLTDLAPTTIANAGFFGSSMGDIDNDGDIDLITDRHIYLNNGAGTFTEHTGPEAWRQNGVIGVGLADFNNDGFLDVVGAAQSVLPFYVFFNNGTPSSSKNWIKIRLRGVESNASAIGARIIVSTTSPARTQIREVSARTGYGSQNSLTQHVGLGTATTVSSITVKWPSGLVQTINNVAANQTITIVEDDDGPLPVDFFPDNLATSISSVTDIEVTLNESITAVAGKHIVVTEVGGAVAADQLVTLGTKNGNKYKFSLTGTPLTLGKQYSVNIDAGAFVDLYGNTSAAIGGSSWTFTVGNGPSVSLLSPLHNATNVATGTSFEITLSTVTTATPSKLIRVFESTDPVNPVFTIDAASVVPTGNKYSYPLPQKLQLNTAYSVSVDAGAFLDELSNGSSAIALGTWNFTTSPGPTITVLSPTNGATSVNTTTTLGITFGGPTTGVAGKYVKVFLSSDHSSEITQVEANGGSFLNNKHTFTFLEKLDINTSYDVVIEPGAFVDAAQNDFAGLSTGWTFQTTAGPQLVTRSPEQSSTSAATDAPLVLTFDRNISAASGKVIVKAGTDVLLDVDVTEGSVSGTTYTLEHETDWPFSTELSVTVQKGAFVDADQNDFAGITEGGWTFATDERPDEEEPVIIYDPAPIATLSKGFAPRNIQLNVTDNKGVTAVTLFHRKISESTFIAKNATMQTDATYQVEITGSMTDDMGFEYYFEAVDALANKGRSPETGAHRSVIKFENNNSPTVTVNGGGTLNDWKIIALPFDLAGGNRQISDIFSELGSASKTTWRMLRYTNTPAEAWLEYPVGFTTMDRGKGYFINSKTAANISLPSPTSPSFTQSTQFQMTLVQGWNQIGNPYTLPVNWENVRTSNNAAVNVGSLLLFTNGSYTPGTTLQSMQGGFVFANIAATVNIPLQTPAGGRVRELSGDLSGDDWQVLFRLSQGNLVNHFSGVGMSATASISYDEYDHVVAPRFFDYVEMSVSHPEHFAKKFARDIVPTQDEFEWVFSVESSLADHATLSWDNAGFGNNDMDLFLFDEAYQWPVNMREVNQYDFDPRHSKLLKVFFGRNLAQKLRASRVLLGQAFPNPTSSSATIPFALPEQGAWYNVQLEVFDLMGRKLETLVDQELSSGYYQPEWAPREKPLDGIYIYKLSVRSAAISEVHSGKLMFRE